MKAVQDVSPSEGSAVEIIVNGSPKTVAETDRISDLVRALGLEPRFIAVERNEQLIPRTQHADCQLAPGDRIEIVTLVGGG